AMYGAAMPPQRRADRAHAGASGALLLPQFLAGAGDQLAVLGGVGAGAQRGAIVLDRFPQQIFVDAAENFFRQLQRTDLLAAQVDYINLCHNQLLSSKDSATLYCFAIAICS